MAEEYQVLNTGTETEGGSEVATDVAADISVIADNIQVITDLGAWLNNEPGAPTPDIDGNKATIQIRRDTDEGWLVDDPVLAQGEIGFITDITPYAYKIGDGVTVFSLLPNAYDGADFVYADLIQQVGAAEAARDEAATSATSAGGSATAAAASEYAAADNAQLAADYAFAPVTTPLPGGKVSAEVSADKAATIANTSRKIDLRSNTAITANETMPAAAIFKRTNCNPVAPITVTIPPNLFQDPNPFEARALYRLLNGGGTVKFVPQGGGSDLQAPSVAIHQMNTLRAVPVAATDKILNGSITLPSAVVDGKLVIQVLVSFNGVAAVVHSCTIDNGMTAIALNALTTPSGSNTFDALVYQSDIASLAAGTVIHYQVKIRPNVNVFGCCARIMTGQGLGGARVATGQTNSAVASISATLSALGNQWRVFAFACKRGLNAACTFSGFSPNISLTQSGDSAGEPESDPGSSYRNINYGLGNGINTAAGDFTVNATFSSATGPPIISLVAYPPKTVTGAGDVNLHCANGDTISDAYNEAELFFAPNGKDVYMRILG